MSAQVAARCRHGTAALSVDPSKTTTTRCIGAMPTRGEIAHSQFQGLRTANLQAASDLSAHSSPHKRRTGSRTQCNPFPSNLCKACRGGYSHAARRRQQECRQRYVCASTSRAARGVAWCDSDSVCPVHVPDRRPLRTAFGSRGTGQLAHTSMHGCLYSMYMHGAGCEDAAGVGAGWVHDVRGSTSGS